MTQWILNPHVKLTLWDLEVGRQLQWHSLRGACHWYTLWWGGNPWQCHDCPFGCGQCGDHGLTYGHGTYRDPSRLRSQCQTGEPCSLNIRRPHPGSYHNWCGGSDLCRACYDLWSRFRWGWTGARDSYRPLTSRVWWISRCLWLRLFSFPIRGS